MLSNPWRVWKLVRDAARETPPAGWSPLAGLVGMELVSWAAALWDRLVPGADHVRWVTLPE